MRMFTWTPDMVRLMRDACELTDFHTALADEIIRALGGIERVAPLHICDAGCGLGYLSLALAKNCARVTAIDVSAPALDVLEQNISARGIDNVTPRLGSVFDLPASARFDCMVFCLFGQLDEALQAARGHCERIVLVKRCRPTHRFALNAGNADHPSPRTTDAMPRKTNALSDTLQRLEALEAPFDVRRVTLSLDQPFRTLSDATLFFRLYGNRDSTADPNERDVLSRLTPGSSADFPWLLKAERELAVITVDLRQY